MTTPDLDESRFPGNTEAYRRLADSLNRGRLVAFTGAGTSFPTIPTWTGALLQLVAVAETNGSLSAEDASVLRSQVNEDPLEVAESLEDAMTRAPFRAEIGRLFGANVCTAAQERLMQLPFKGFVTLNYDNGLTAAYVRKFREVPKVVRAEERYEIDRWNRGELIGGAMPIIHWHGVATAPDTMVLTSSDYRRFYDKNENVSFLQELWRRDQVVAVGFGFKDPFLTNALEEALRSAATNDQHFAFIGWNQDSGAGPLIRKSFTKKYRMSPIFYPVITSEAGIQDHSALLQLLESLTVSDEIALKTGETLPIRPEVNVSNIATLASLPPEYQGKLLTSNSGGTLYIEPRLYRPQNSASALNEAVEAVTISQVVSSENSVMISAPHEHGLTTLGQRLLREFSIAGEEAFLREASELPAYKSKLEKEAPFLLPKNAKRILILDNFGSQAHDRLLKEIVGLSIIDRIIVLCPSTGGTSIDEISPHLGSADMLILSQLHREDIRSLTRQMYATADSDLVSAVVEKVYNDLLDLCIPLTPHNVIIYISVFYSEGSFMPLSRLQIVDRYIRDRLKRPSDSFRDAFNVENKLDIISSFVHSMYESEQTEFSEAEWYRFCEKIYGSDVNFI